MKASILLLLLSLSPVALAKPPPAGQGRPCGAKRSCGAGLQCVDKATGSASCEIACADNKSCPEDQRCVKDGTQKICRPINDATGL
jgi:hypothetical protein